MKIVRQMLLSIVLTALAASAWADPPARVGRLNYLNGTVSFATAEAPDRWSYAVRNRPLTSGDRLWADRDGSAEFHVGSTAVRLDATTSVDVLHLDDHRVALNIARGRVNVRVREMDAHERVELRTPGGTVFVRQPGSYRIAADDGAQTAHFGVNFGAAEIGSGGYNRLLVAGEAVRMHRSYAPAFEPLARVRSDNFDRWSAERDRMEDRVAATRYVSPHMTGYEDLDAHGTWREESHYGALWYPTHVPPEWAPYRYGRWERIEPWGWTWIDDAPWGFAPFHYGRWVRVHDRWAWAPGVRVHRPVYAPALVAFVAGSSWSVGVGSAPPVAWVPLGWREPYRPWYRASTTHVTRVNVHHHQHHHEHPVHQGHRHWPEAIAVVPQHSFGSLRAAAHARAHGHQDDRVGAPVTHHYHPAEHRGATRRAAEAHSRMDPSVRSQHRIEAGAQMPPTRELTEREREDIEVRERHRANLEWVQRLAVRPAAAPSTHAAPVVAAPTAAAPARRFEAAPAQQAASPVMSQTPGAEFNDGYRRRRRSSED